MMLLLKADGHGLPEMDHYPVPGEPTAAQAAAGNYAKRTVRWQGLDIAIENPAGSVRRGDGWQTRMLYDYGYVRRSEGADGDEVDVYLGPALDFADDVYIVHQRKFGDWDRYDEDKAMIGFMSMDDAAHAYLKHYDDPRFLGDIVAMPVAEFVAKVKATREEPGMLKSHVHGYTKKDGTVVASHERRPMYVSRKVLNGQELHDWAVGQGFSNVTPPHKMHVTVAYSRTPVHQEAVEADTGELLAHPAHVAHLGDDDAVVMHVSHPSLHSRHHYMRSMGASWDFETEGYNPHVSISYMKQPIPEGLQPFPGPLVLGPEVVEDLKRGWGAAVAAEAAPAPRPHPTETEAFKRWFAGSKVVDADGKPLVVYHGATNDFAAFKAGSRGAWFTASGEEAGQYAFWKGPGANVMPVYLSIKNPYKPTPHEMDRWVRGINGASVPKRIEAEIVAVAKESGHDGVVMWRDDRPYYIAFRPEQIKSAIGNNGDFDPENPDMTKSAPLLVFPGSTILAKGGKAGAPGLVRKIINDKRGRTVTHWVRNDNEGQLDLFAGIGEPYNEKIELRPGTQDKQLSEGRNALSELQRVVRRLELDGERRAALLGASIYRDFVATGSGALNGMQIGSAAELAAAAQVYRDPRFETLRFVYMRGSEVVGENTVSSRLPGVVYPPADFTETMKADMAALGADGYHLIHNHPSGSSQPSRADEQLTRVIAAKVPGFQSHVVIDHVEYSVINAAGDSTTFDAPSLGGLKFQDHPGAPHPLLGQAIHGPGELAMAARVLQRMNQVDDKTAVIAVTTGGSIPKLAMLCSIPSSHIAALSRRRDDVHKVRAWLRSLGRRAGTGGHIFMVVNGAEGDPHLREGVSRLMKSGTLTDVYDGKTNTSLRKPFTDVGGSSPFHAAKPGNMTALKVAEGDVTDSEAFKRWFGDSKIVDADGKPLKVYHGTMEEFTSFDPEFFGSGDGNADWGEGFYFTDTRAAAESYTGDGDGRVMEVYLRVTNPAPPEVVLEVMDHPGAEMDTDYMRDTLEEMGYDGIVVTHRGGEKEIVVFRPNQIKSAEHNSGAYDPRDTDIHKADAPLVLFLKARVGPYLRGGKLVNLAGYDGRAARAPEPDPNQMGLFPADDGGAPAAAAPAPAPAPAPVAPGDDPAPYPMPEPRKMFRAVSPEEWEHIKSTGKIAGGLNTFNGFDNRREVFFGPAMTDMVIGQGEDITRRSEYQTQQSILGQQFRRAAQEVDDLQQEMNEAVARVGRLGASHPSVRALRTRLYEKGAELDRLRAKGRELIEKKRAELREADEKRGYSSVVLETRPVTGGTVYTGKHSGMGKEDEYGFPSGHVSLDDVVKVRYVKAGKVIREEDGPAAEKPEAPAAPARVHPLDESAASLHKIRSKASATGRNAGLYQMMLPDAERRHARLAAAFQAFNAHGDGTELSTEDGKRHAILLPDASSPGKYRYQMFDGAGFSAHSTHDTPEQAVADAVQSGYHVHNPGVLDRLAGTDEWAHGMAMSAIMQAHNSGQIDWRTATDRMAALQAEREAKHKPAPAVAAPAVVEPDDHPSRPTRSLLGMVPQDKRDEWLALHREQHELHHYEMGQSKERLARARAPMNRAATAMREMEAQEAGLKRLRMPGDEERIQAVIDAKHRFRKTFEKHRAEVDREAELHQKLYERAAELGRQKNAIAMPTGDLNMDWAAMRKRTDAEQQQHEKSMLKQYRDYYKNKDAANKAAKKAGTMAKSWSWPGTEPLLKALHNQEGTMTKQPVMLLLKSHVAGYVKKDGTFVQEHDDKRAAKDWRDEENWHSRTMARMKTLAEAELHYVAKDAREAAKNAYEMGNKEKGGRYDDEAHYAQMELNRRNKGG